MTRRPEVLAPAGDAESLDAAIAAGADAVYFGLQSWSARARATNFDERELDRTMAKLHRAGVKGYVALNTLVFDAVYNPPKTKLLEQAESAGAKTVGGVEMFVRQAAAQFEAWTRQPAPIDIMRQVIERRLASSDK